MNLKLSILYIINIPFIFISKLFEFNVPLITSPINLSLPLIIVITTFEVWSDNNSKTHKSSILTLLKKI